MRVAFGYYFRDFFYYLILSFQRSFQLNGRASCAEFWYFQLFLYPFSWLEIFLGSYFSSLSGIFQILFLLICPAMISLFCRRLHDCHFSGWWLLLYPFLVIACLPLLRFLLVPFFMDVSWKGLLTNPWWILEGNIVSLILSMAFYGRQGDQGPNFFGQVPPFPDRRGLKKES